MSDLFDDPGTSSSGDRFDMKANTGALLLIKPLKKVDNITTAFGDKDATSADVHVVDGPNAGKVYTDSLIFPGVLQGQLRSNIGTGRFNLGRLGQRVSKPGQQPAWALDVATEPDKEMARKYLAGYKEPVAAAAPADNWSQAPF